MISSWLLYMYLYFTSLWYLLDYCTCAFASPVYDIFMIIVHVHLLHQSMISSWLLYMYIYLPVYDIFLISVHVPLLHQSMISSWLLYMNLCFTSLWYLPDYCTYTFVSPVYDIFQIIVHVLLLHQSMISSWLLYMYLCFTNLWYLPDYYTCILASPVYDWRYHRLVKQRHMYNNQEDIIDWWSKGTCTIIRKIS
jgi:hypothetical protein